MYLRSKKLSAGGDVVNMIMGVAEGYIRLKVLSVGIVVGVAEEV